MKFIILTLIACVLSVNCGGYGHMNNHYSDDHDNYFHPHHYHDNDYYSYAHPRHYHIHHLRVHSYASPAMNSFSALQAQEEQPQSDSSPSDAGSSSY